MNGSSVTAQRLKRLASVEAKIRRFPKMLVSRMQDLGGCRAILPTADDVDRLLTVYETKWQGHEFVRKYDYLEQPKSSGYRSVHLVYRYRSRNERNAGWNGLRIEVQLRSRLQHAWATAVETVDALTGTRLKTQGPENGGWDRFFQLMGSVFAIEEGRARVPGTPAALAELRAEVRELVESLEVSRTLAGLRAAVDGVPDLPGAAWFLMTLDARERKVWIRVYRESGFEAARAEYLKREQEDRSGFLTCLVSVESAKALRRAYPNYFLDVGVFNETLIRFLGGPRT